MKKKKSFLWVALYLLNVLVMVYTSENFDTNKDFSTNFLAWLLTQNYTEKKASVVTSQ